MLALLALLLTDCTATRKPIRIYFDLTYLSKNNELPLCQEADQEINIWDGKYVCQKGDVENFKEKVEAISKTLENCKQYLSDLLKVDPVDSMNLTCNDDDKRPHATNPVDDCDLHITVYPFLRSSDRNKDINGVILATSDVYQLVAYIYDDISGYSRTFAGNIHLNMAEVPTEPANINSTNRKFFETILHEMIHILGFQRDLFDDWVDSTKKQYADNPVKECTITYEKGSRTIKVLRTPKLQEWFKDRYGIEEIANGCPAGIELNEGESHFSQRIAYTELMNPVDTAYTRISNLTLALLEDTGWYNVDRSKAELFEFGDYRSIVGKTEDDFKRFPDGIPDKEWPKHYVCGERTGDVCTWDHRGYGTCTEEKTDCSSCKLASDNACPAVCREQWFFDPENKGYIGDEIYNYVRMPIANSDESTICQNSLNQGDADKGYVYGGESYCAQSSLSRGSTATEARPGCFRMTCDKDNNLTVWVDGINQTCETADMKLAWDGYNGYLTCPDPDIVCGIINYDSIVHSATDNFMTPTVIALIAVGSTAGVAVIVSLVLYLRKRICLRQSEESDSTSSLHTALVLV